MPSSLPTDPPELVFTAPAELCILRRRRGRGFSYHRDGRVEQDAATLERIRRLAIPPAWRDVRICAEPGGHLQAVGRDARGRVQYRYHPHFRARQDESKFARLAEFGAALPAIRAAVARDLAGRDLSKARVLAVVVRLLETTLVRVGNAAYAKENKTFGLTTLRNRHVDVAGSTLRFAFTGKSGKVWRLSVNDRRVASVVKACQELPGQHLFEYLDADGAVRALGSSDVNAYLRAASGAELTAKDFRTWAGTLLAAEQLSQRDPPSTPTAAAREIREAVRWVAARLGNTPAVCRASYIHPRIPELFAEGRLARDIAARSGGRRPEALVSLDWAILRILRAERRNGS